MPSTNRCATLTIVSLLVFTLACSFGSSPSPAALPTETSAPSGMIPTSTVMVSASSTAPAGMPTPRNTPVPFPTDIQQVRMVDELDGWASDSMNGLYRTDDGGQSWYAVAVPGAYTASFSAFLDPTLAWLADYDAHRSPALWRTTDGGLTWTHLTDIGLPNTGGEPVYQFTSAEDGLVELAGFGEGKLYGRLFETHDGGLSFEPVPFLGPTAETGRAEGVIQYCRLCGSTLFYDGSRAILVQGNLQEPPGSVKVQQSIDRGETWNESTLPLPAGYQDALVVALPLVIAGNGHGYLPIRMLHYSAAGKAYDAVSLYISADGGATWSLSPTVLPDAEPFMLNFHDLDVEVLCGGKLCVSHDGAQSWETLTPSVDFSRGDTHYVLQMTFASARTGWILLWENGTTRLYRTTDGGTTWTLLNS